MKLRKNCITCKWSEVDNDKIDCNNPRTKKYNWNGLDPVLSIQVTFFGSLLTG